jgi:hypothetical protein
LYTRYARSTALALFLGLAACSGGTSTQPVSAVPATQPNFGATPPGSANTRMSCATRLPRDTMTCYAIFRTDVAMRPPGVQPAAPSGYGPADLQSAYALPSASQGAGQKVAIVDAYDDPNAEADLGVYRTQFGLSSCTSSNGCFKKVSQTGSTTSLPPANGGWAQEESLDVDMVSAICPKCSIVLVEATSASNANLATAENQAITQGANVVSNSYGGGETGGSNQAYNHPGHIITASAGDSGTGAQQPCSYATVVCIGGTTISRTNNARGWTETVWSGTGSGCSRYVTKPSYQTDKGCTKRSEADVSADANPNTGVAVYDSYSYQGYKGWLVFGGTSVSSPAIAAVYALAGNASSENYAQSIWAAGGTAALNDVTSGSNGRCSKSYPYICKAGVGYDGPTGWGTPNGIAAF